MATQTNGRIAVFGVDGTLLRGDCLWLVVRSSKGPLGQLLATLDCMPWLIGWQLRLVSTERMKQHTIVAFGLCEAVNRVEASIRTDWLLGELLPHLRPEALQRLRWHQRRGDRVLLCSASPRPLLQPLAEWLGVELLCTDLQQSDGRWLPLLASPNCKGPEKVRRLEQHLGPLAGLPIEAYSYSKSDRDLLKAATIPHYQSFINQPHPYPAFEFGFLLPVAALALLAYGLLGMWSQGGQLLPLLQSLWPSIGLGLLVVTLSYGFRFSRWRRLLHAVNQHPPIQIDARIWMGSYAFTATPGKVGEAVRSLLLKDYGVPVTQTLIALVVERLTDFFAVLFLLIVNMPLLLNLDVPLIVPLSISIVAVFAGYLGLRNSWTKNKLLQIARVILPRKLSSAGGGSLIVLRHLLKPEVLLPCTLISVTAWSMEGVCLWMLLKAMQIHDVCIMGAIFAHTTAGLLGALSLLPGGIGTTEASTYALLALQGVPMDKAIPATLLIRLMTLWFSTVLGIICLWGWKSRSINQA